MKECYELCKHNKDGICEIEDRLAFAFVDHEMICIDKESLDSLGKSEDGKRRLEVENERDKD